MFNLDDGTLVLSASDLTSYLACGHLTQQKLAIARGKRAKPHQRIDPHMELVREHGEEFEKAQLGELTRGTPIVDLTPEHTLWTRTDLEKAAMATGAAMTDGAPLIYQATLFDGRWQGRIDLLRRIEIPSALGDWSYEVVDMKLARHVKPYVVHQLSLYNRLVAVVQDLAQPVAWVMLGDGTNVPIELGKYAALHRHVVAQLERVIADEPADTYPEPVSHCNFCDFSDECSLRRRSDDHLSLVAGIRRDQREKLVAVELDTVARLGAASPDHERGRLGAHQFDLLRNQAALQVQSRESGEPRHRQLQPIPERGYARVPEPSPGDIFFDLEGDPFIGADGIEYLWGWYTADGGYDCIWAHDAEQERAALERFVDFIVERRREDPRLHVYHYAPLEASTLKSLALKYATREEAVDVLLRAGVLVDLYAVVRQGLQVGEESYSLKRLERHHGFDRLEKSIRAGGGSIVAYESWLKIGDEAVLEAIRAYNEDDCRSTWALRNWLHGTMKPEAIATFGADAFGPGESEEPTPPPAWLEGVQELIARLTEGLAADPAEDTRDEAERRLMAQLLLYHYRESKPEWWRFFDLCAKTSAELVDEADAIGELELDPDWKPRPVNRSLEYRFTFPPQEFKLGDRATDPATGKQPTIVEVGDNYLILRRGKGNTAPFPEALIPGSPLDPSPMRNALIDAAEDLLAGNASFTAARAILRRELPRLSSGSLGPSVEELVSATLGLDRSYLPVQGPPGTGKTYRGARMVVEALRTDRRVGVTAFSHAAIKNLLCDIEDYAIEAGVDVRGIYKGDDYDSPHGLVEATGDNDTALGDFNLVAGTSWLFSRPEWRSQLELLFIDEAGQLSLASAIASATSAQNVVLLGDPQQLPQVTQAQHPDRSGDSVLEYVLGGRSTIGPEQGVLLEETWRMHPDVCAFVSERSYDSRLRSRPGLEGRRIDASGLLSGAGLLMVPVEHQGRSQASAEEAATIATLCETLIGGTIAHPDGTTTRLTADDIMVVAPYNLAVRCMSEHVPAGVRVGTVDRFQGQEAPVVFFSMTSSSGEDVPRGLDFLFNKNRLNVAISRAQCLAVVVASPRLLDADCRTLHAMELVDGVCRFAEMASLTQPAVRVSFDEGDSSV